MWRIVINVLKICASSWSLAKVIEYFVAFRVFLPLLGQQDEQYQAVPFEILQEGLPIHVYCIIR
jgi:hypothetical protein